MGKKYPEISEEHRAFIRRQNIFFVGTAASEGRVNVSPKGMDTLRVVNKNKVIWLNLTGSGNETAAHLLEHNRMTIMFCAFEGEPLILRLYGHARVHYPRDESWNDYIDLFPAIAGARQIVEMDVDLVQTSCGMGVPRLHYVEDRELLRQWAEEKGDAGLKQYWQEKNQLSLDGKATDIVKG